MTGKTSVLESEYIIDGVRMDASPKMMLEAACGKAPSSSAEYEAIVDENVDPAPADGGFDSGGATGYLKALLNADSGSRICPAAYPDAFSRGRISQALIDAIWKEGHFRLGNLCMDVKWRWDTGKVGGMASFYSSVKGVCEWLDDLGVRMKAYKVEEGCGSIATKVMLTPDSEEDEIFGELPFKASNPSLFESRACPATVAGDRNNWLVFIPFVPCNFRLGGSMLSEITGISGGKSPDIIDSDYFIDCYEVVRELVEDGIVLSGATVGDGGLMTALGRLAGDKGAEVNIRGIMEAYGDRNPVEVLFAEVPGAIIEIRDDDYDYIDAELMLQDVAFYPIGHPGGKALEVSVSESDGIAGILQSLLSGQASEGED